MSETDLTQERLRELGRAVAAVFPPGLAYCMIVWPTGETQDCGYFSNTHRIEARVALERVMGAIRQEGGSWELESP